MDRNLALEFVRVTEAAAIEAARWIGRGDKEKADGAAVNAMRARLNQIDFSGTVVIGEGEKDEAPMLYTGEKVGTKKAQSWIWPSILLNAPTASLTEDTMPRLLLPRVQKAACFMLQILIWIKLPLAHLVKVRLI